MVRGGGLEKWFPASVSSTQWSRSCHEEGSLARSPSVVGVIEVSIKRTSGGQRVQMGTNNRDS